MRAWIVVLLVAATLSGCTEAEPVDLKSQQAVPPAEPEPEPEPPAPEPAPRPAPNRVPRAALAADATAGDAPVNVTFTLNGTDEDGDALTWTFDKEDDGTIDEQGSRLPATIEQAYPAGTHTARLVVYDGVATANATVVIESFGPPPEPEPPEGPVQELNLSWPVGGTSLPALLAELDAQLCGPGPHDGTLHAAFDVAAASRGGPLTASAVHAALPETVVGWGVLFLAEDCGESAIVSAEGTAPLAGTVPAFAAWAIAYSDGGGDITVSYAAG